MALRVFRRSWLPLLVLLLVAGCDGPQSALDVAGREAALLADLFWIMLAGAVIVWLLVIGTAVYASHFRRGEHRLAVARWFLLGGGVAFPVVVLAGLLSYGLFLLSDLRPAEADLTVEVVGESFWWRVRYEGPDGRMVETANEIRLPVGRTVAFVLSSPDVIHSFWIPALGGKLDMIPGRTNRLVLEPTRTGDFRGACAEFCGTSHALMAFPVKVMEPEAFADWLASEAAPAVPPEDELARTGEALFQSVGCSGCHAVRGSAAEGTIGPDLTHLASRASLASGTLPMEEAALRRFIAHPQEVKPGVKMPAFAPLGPERIAALAAYLASLK